MTHRPTLASPLRAIRALAQPGRPGTPGQTRAVLVSGRIAAFAAAASCGLLAACGTAAPGAAPTTTVTVHASTTTTTTSPAASPAASPASSPAPAGAAAAGPAGCLASALHPTLGAAQGTAGTFYQVVVLTNSSATTCSLYGYPGVSFVTGVGGQQIGAAATRNPAVASAIVTLPPGGQANMLLALHDAGAYSPPQCEPTSVDWLRIYPPGDYGSVYVQYQAQTCAAQSEAIMSVTAVRTGAGTASA